MKRNNRGKGGMKGLFARGKQGKTASASNSGRGNNRKQVDFSSRNDNEFLIGKGLSNSLESINAMALGGGQKRKRQQRRRRGNLKGMSPLDEAQEKQKEDSLTSSPRVPRKSQFQNGSSSSSFLTLQIGKPSSSRRKAAASADGRPAAHHGRQNNHAPNNKGKAATYAAHTTEGLRRSFALDSPESNKSGERRTDNNDEVVDLCDDDESTEKQYHEGDTTITEHSVDSTSRQSGRSSSSSSRSFSKEEDATSFHSSLAGTPAQESSATSGSASIASDGENEESSDEDILVMRSTRKKTKLNKSPAITQSAPVVAVSDLFPGQEDDEEEQGPSVCNVLDGILNETYPEIPEAKAQKRSPAKRSSSSESRPSKTLRKSPDSDASSPTSSTWGNAPLISEPKAQSKLGLTKVNYKKKRKPTPIVPGRATRGMFSDPTKTDPIEDSDSEVEGFPRCRRLARMSVARPNPYREGGVQANPYATTRASRPRTAKTKAAMKTVNVDSDDGSVDEYEFDDERTPNVKKTSAAVRIAIGTKVLSDRCYLRYTRNFKRGKIMLTYDDKAGKRINHDIDLDDDSVMEMKYCLANDADVVSIDFDETEEMSFLSMQVEPNAANGLSRFPNAYKPTDSEADARKRYIAIEFRSDSELRSLIKELKKDATLKAYVTESSKLKPSDAEVYASSLLKEAEKERKTRESSLSSPLVRRTRKRKGGSKSATEIVLVFPFGADEDKIDTAASGLLEAEDSRLASVSKRDSTEKAPAALKTTGDDEKLVAPSSDDADDDDEKEDSDAGKTKSRSHFLTIRGEDVVRLEPGEFLNDTLIDFWFQWIWRKERHSDTEVHFFTSHFYSALAKGGPSAVTSWTAKKNIDIFTKKFIFIPINQSLHWSLCVVVNPGEIRNEIVECGIECDDDSLLPCIFFFDSLKAHRKNIIANNVRDWLNSEWERLGKAKAEFEKTPFTTKTMRVYDPRVPYQDNSWDCGVFVCRYGYAMYLLRSHNVTYGDRKSRFSALITESDEFDFDREDIVRIRDDLYTLISRLSDIYKVWKKLSDEAEKKRAQEEEESKKPAARRLLLENGDAGATEEKEEATGTSVDGGSASTSAQEPAAASSVEDQTATDSASTNSPPKLSETAQETEPDKSSLVEVDVENDSIEGTKELSKLSLESKVYDVETAETAEDEGLSQAETGKETANSQTSLVKVEEDQYGGEAQCAGEAVEAPMETEEAAEHKEAKVPETSTYI